MKRLFIVAFLLTSIFLQASCSRGEEDKEIVRNSVIVDDSVLSNISVYELNDRYSLNCNTDQDTGIITVSGDFDDLIVQSESDAIFALSTFQSLFHISDLSYSCRIDITENDNVVYDMTQMYQNVPVYKYGFKLLTDKSGRLISIKGKYADDILCNPNNHISLREAREAIRKDIIINSYELIIFRENSRIYAPAWYLNVNDGESSGYIILNAVNRMIVEWDYLITN